jgi:exosortase D (VPLPA-CTERM-specific)
MSLAFISGYFYRDVMWKRVLIFISSIPIAILLNSLRIGLIGVTVEYWGQDAAEGLLHDFEGWVMFMACMSVIVAEMWLLTKVGKRKRSLSQVFSIDIPDAKGISGDARTRSVPPAYGAAIGLLMAAAVAAYFIESRVEVAPERQDFAGFPTQFGEWKGNPDTMESILQERLDFDDYIISNYLNDSGKFINLYIAYYGEQRKGASIHSPRACLPGGGWEIASLEDHAVEGAVSGGKTLVVNRAVIKKGEVSQLVYYWFKQRERNETDEFLIKWWLFWDALTRNRTDGALVRLTAVVPPGEDMKVAEERLSGFTRLVYPKIIDYVPD